MSCTFSTNIAEILSCSVDGEFDHNGFPINECKLFPCPKYKEMVKVGDGKPAQEDIIKNFSKKYALIGRANETYEKLFKKISS